MNKIIVYEHPDFKGLSKEFTSDVPDLTKLNFNYCISSLKVIGNPWMVTEDLDNPQITLYEEENYQGRSLVLDCETNLCYGDFNDKTSSHKVQRGAWVLYQHGQRGGYILVARAGRDVPKYDS
ncbi:epidermal differentiation-specific protein-like [Tachysurus vachellii]|uniref:epidermal differentiation-specific protein-like n=1 Tax=Tachysurus vachellii TaxID=175792 RepID=UPI00296AFAE0|nr:epidermal differentiation-specific protein-like [Tachysurus vachellii]